MRRACSAVTFTVLAAPLATQVATATLTPDRDNTIYSPHGVPPPFPCTHWSNGRGDRIVAGFWSLIARRALMHFDVSGSIPTGASILQVELDLTVVRVPSHQGTSLTAFALHPATTDWGEGQSNASTPGAGAAAEAGDATWCEPFFGRVPFTAWRTPGGDFGSPSATTLVGTTVGETHTFASNQRLVADVQSWLDDPTSNMGWFLLGNEFYFSTLSTTRAFASREDPPRAPRLIVTYYTPPLPYWSGCDTSGATRPTLEIDPAVGLARPAIGNPFRLQLEPGGSPFVTTALAMSLVSVPGGTPIPFGACRLHIAPELIASTDASDGVTLALPSSSVLLGLDLYWQGLALTTGSGLALTHGHVTHIRD